MGWFIITLTRGNLDRKVEGGHEAALVGCAVVKGSHRHRGVEICPPRPLPHHPACGFAPDGSTA
jgi:hypothetical protein